MQSPQRVEQEKCFVVENKFSPCWEQISCFKYALHL